METTKLQAEVRASRGKGPARRLRAEGKTPAVVYGPGLEPTALTVSPKELTKALTGEYGRNVVLSLCFGDQEIMAMVRDIAVDPVTRDVLHADFYKVTDANIVDYIVPLTTHGRATGVQRGGKLTVVFRELPVRSRPGEIPASISIDVSNIDIGDIITVADLVLPEGVSVTLSPKRTVLGVYEDTRAKADTAAT